MDSTPSTTQLPADVSEENWRMTADTLWCAWSRPPEERVRIGFSPPVIQHWLLADPAPAGMAQIQDGFENEFLAAMPFKTVLKVVEDLQATAPQSTDHFWPAWFKPTTQHYVVLIQDPDKSLRTHSLMAPSEQEAMAMAQGEGNVMMCGALADMKQLVENGQAILDQKDYNAVLDDCRPVAPGHPDDWITFMRDPEQAQWVRDFLEE